MLRKHHIVWTMVEEMNLCKAIVARWLEAGYTGVHTDHYREVMELAALECGGFSTLSDEYEGWRARRLSSRDGRRFIQIRMQTLEKMLTEGTRDERVLTYAIPGHDDRLTPEQMQEEIMRLRAEVKALRAELAPPPPPETSAPVPIRVRPRSIECPFTSPSLPQKMRVAIAGVHDKHRDAIVRAFPNLIITWIEPRDNDALIKTKASGRPAIACTHGTNGKVMKLLNNVCTKFFQVGGAHGVRETLANAKFQ